MGKLCWCTSTRGISPTTYRQDQRSSQRIRHLHERRSGHVHTDRDGHSPEIRSRKGATYARRAIEKVGHTLPDFPIFLRVAGRTDCVSARSAAHVKLLKHIPLLF